DLARRPARRMRSKPPRELPKTKRHMQFSRQFERALVYATRIHSGQFRKKTRIPYVAHILVVAAIALEYAANETDAISALLHDAVEVLSWGKRMRANRES